jgi:hypothetical protein
MVFKTISYSTQELGQLSGVAKDVPAISLYDEANLNRIYLSPKRMRIINSTGGTIQVVPFTSLEYKAYQSGGASFSTFYSIANSTTSEIDELKRQISKVVVSGSAGASSKLDVVFRYE